MLNSTDFRFRTAQKKDIKLVIKFIKELAEYENMLDQVKLDESELSRWLFEENAAEVIFAMKNNLEIGFALYFYNFSTFTGSPGLYIEDLYLYPEYRGNGYGKLMLKKLAQIAISKRLSRLEWACLDWNKPSIDFYLSIGANQLNDRRSYRLDDDALTKFIE